jgi:hypothetical protein
MLEVNVSRRERVVMSIGQRFCARGKTDFSLMVDRARYFDK